MKPRVLKIKGKKKEKDIDKKENVDLNLISTSKTGQ